MNFEFRVFHKQEKRYGRRCDLDENRIDYEFNGGFADLAFCLKHPEWYQIEQWTGLTDNNGVKIFDGDIVKRLTTRVENSPYKLEQYYAGPEGVYPVLWGNFSDGEYSDEVQCWMLGNYHSLSELIHRETYQYRHFISTYQVVGNINENPEILIPEQSSEI